MASKDKDNPFSFKSFVTKRQGVSSEPQKKETSKSKKKTGETATSVPPTGIDSLPPPGSVASGKQNCIELSMFKIHVLLILISRRQSILFQKLCQKD